MLCCPKPWAESGFWGVGMGCVRGWQHAELSLAECGCWYRWDTTATPARWILYPRSRHRPSALLERENEAWEG